MLFYLFITFQILYSVSCYISCYDTPADANNFDYIITADNLPTELRSSSLKTNSVNCMIQVVWQRSPHNTRIALIAETGMKAVSTNHKLEVDLGYENLGAISVWQEMIVYQCNTDQCNSLSRLKLLLSSLTTEDSLIDLVYLLYPIKPFRGEWCYRRANATFQKCDTMIPNNLCRQCESNGRMNQTATELCATCSTDDHTRYVLAVAQTFNLIDRTSTFAWVIMCGREHCSTPTIGDSILEKTHIHLDFNKFLNNETTILSMNKMVLFFIIFFMKSFFS